MKRFLTLALLLSIFTGCTKDYSGNFKDAKHKESLELKKLEAKKYLIKLRESDGSERTFTGDQSENVIAVKEAFFTVVFEVSNGGSTVKMSGPAEGWNRLFEKVDGAAQNAEAAKEKDPRSISPCERISVLICAQEGSSASDCDEGISVLSKWSKAQDSGERVKAELLEENCQRNLDTADSVAKHHGFKNYEDLVRKKATNPKQKELLKKLDP